MFIFNRNLTTVLQRTEARHWCGYKGCQQTLNSYVRLPKLLVKRHFSSRFYLVLEKRQ
jgi:hypothetical protein